MPEATDLTAHEFVCRFCGAKTQIFYDWQRCWECYQAAGTRNLQTIPSVCPTCCRKKHQKPLSSK